MSHKHTVHKRVLRLLVARHGQAGGRSTSGAQTAVVGSFARMLPNPIHQSRILLWWLIGLEAVVRLHIERVLAYSLLNDSHPRQPFRLANVGMADDQWNKTQFQRTSRHRRPSTQASLTEIRVRLGARLCYRQATGGHADADGWAAQRVAMSLRPRRRSNCLW